MSNHPRSSSTGPQAIVIHRKKLGILKLTQSSLKFIPNDGPGSSQNDVISIDRSRLQSLLSSKEGGPKAVLKIGAKPLPTDPSITSTADKTNSVSVPVEQSFKFDFADPNHASEDRNLFKDVLSSIISQNRNIPEPKSTTMMTPSGSTEGPGRSNNSNDRQHHPKGDTSTNNHLGPEKGKAIDPLQDWRLKKRVLQNHPDLRQLHKEMVIGGQISEGEFWDGREELLYHEARLESQRVGRSAQMVDPRPETTETGEIRISITPQMIRDIFEQYPIVQKIYNENVPPLNDQTFWTRYFRSRLFNRHRSSARQSGDAVRDDEIFDKYLGDDDDGIEPKNINTREVFKLLDLAATQEDHVETGNSNDWTMRAGIQRSSLPLMRRFNEHSQRLLDSALGKIPEKRFSGLIDGGDAGSRNYYGETDLEDLRAQSEPERIMLDMQGREKYFEGSGASNDTNSKKRKRTKEEDLAIMHRINDRLTRRWKPELGRFKPPVDQINESTRFMLDNITIRSEQKRGFDEASMPKDFLNQMISTYTTTNEFLRQFWTSILPNPTPTPSTALHNNSSTEQEDKLMVVKSLTPEQKALKSQRMINFLDKTNDRIQHLCQTFNSHLQDNHDGIRQAHSSISSVFRGVVRSVEIAQSYYKDRTS